MVRTLTAAAQTKASTLKGTEPIIVVKVEWGSGTIYYADKAITIGAITAKGAVIDLGAVNSQVKTDNIGQVSSVNIGLDDTDGTLKTLVDRDAIEGTRCTVYLHFVGLGQSDLVKLFSGRVASDIVWSEGDRTLSFNIETQIEGDELGFAPKEGDITNLNPEAVDVPWPLCFGKPLRVPAVQIRKQIRGALKDEVTHGSPSPFYVENGENFPQGTPITIVINGIAFTGSFNGQAFTPTGWNVARHTSVALAARPISDPDKDNHAVAWLASSSISIQGLYCIVNRGIQWFVNRCIRQEGTKCWFQKDWMYDIVIDGSITKVLLDNTDTIYETAGRPRGAWNSTYKEYNWIWTMGSEWYNDDRVIGFSETRLSPDSYTLAEGTEVLYDGGFNDLYVCNLIQSIDIIEVYGHRNFNGETIFAPIPSSYYTVNKNHLLAGQNCTTLEFDKPLIDYECEGWEGDVYVSLESSADQNVSNIIKWILEAYTDLTADPTSFAVVKAKLRSGASEKYPANFAYLEKRDSIKACEEIAWQARIAMIVDGDTVYLKYLSEVPSSDYTADESAVEMKTLELGFTPTEDIVTTMIAKWRTEMSGEEGTERTFEYSNNTSQYGAIEQEYDFYIYNIESLVKLSAAFWGYRYSNSWRKSAFNTFLPPLKLEAFDTIAHDLNIIGSNTLRGVVQTFNLETDDKRIGLETIIASKAGDDVAGQPVEDTKYWTGDPSYSINGNPVPTDPSTGRDETNYVPAQDTECLERLREGEGGGTGGGGGSDPNEPDDPFDRRRLGLKFRQGADSVNRGENFAVQIDLINLDTFMTVSRTIDVEITFNNGGSGDSLNIAGVGAAPQTVRLNNGTWLGNVNIDGGAGDAQTTITASPVPAGYGPDIQMPVRIAEGNGLQLQINQNPIVNGTAFSVSGTGTPSTTWNITWESSDGSGSLNLGTLSTDGAGDIIDPGNLTLTGGTEGSSGRIIAELAGDNSTSNSVRVGTDDEVAGTVNFGDTIPIIVSKAGTKGTSKKARRDDLIPGLKLDGNAADSASNGDPTLGFVTSDGGLKVLLGTGYTSTLGKLTTDSDGLYVLVKADAGLENSGDGLGLIGDTKGELLLHTGSAWTVLSIGTTDQVLTVEGGTAVWKDAAGGGPDPYNSTPTTVLDATGYKGDSDLYSRGDHEHGFNGYLFAGWGLSWYYGQFIVDYTAILDGSGVRKVDTTGNAPGVATVAAPADHKHGFDGTLFAGTGISWYSGAFHVADVPASGTTGDMLYYNGGWIALGIGSSDQFLKVSGGVPVWSDPISPLSAGDGIDITSSVVSVDLVTTNPGLQFVSGELDVKLKSGGGLAKDSSGMYVVWA